MEKITIIPVPGPKKIMITAIIGGLVAYSG